MPSVFVNQEWNKRILQAQKDIAERYGIRDATVSQALDYIYYNRLPPAAQLKQ